MSRYVLRRLLMMVPILLGITIINYTIFALAPGDPVTSMIDPMEQLTMSQEQIDARREALGLNDPIPVRYLLWLGEAVQGNLGYSIVFSRPVWQLLRIGIGNTLGLVSLALLISTVGGVILGIASALRPYSKIDYATTAFAFSGAAMPGFFLGLLLMYVFALQLKLLPAGGIRTAGGPPSLQDWLTHLILPVMALAYETLAGLLRYTRSSMLEVLNQDYVTTARSKGLRETVVVMRHAFRNALLPVLTIIGLRIPSLVGGSILIETVFNYPGIGLTMVQATRHRDYPLLMGGVLVGAVMVLGSNLITDLTYSAADPRVRYD